jgi:5-methylcytosine-specific restriction endonuclease McrA
MIRKRDRYSCALCGKRPAYDVHHIDYDKANTTEGNCITLCHPCHSRTNINREHWHELLSP